jgi:hypothetical protein
MASQQMFEREGKKYIILQSDVEYVKVNKSDCIRIGSQKKCINIQKALNQHKIKEVIAENEDDLFGQKRELFDGKDSEYSVVEEPIVDEAERTRIRRATNGIVYFMPVDQFRAQVYLVHGLIYPDIYDKPGLSKDFDDLQRNSPAELILFKKPQVPNNNQLLLKILLHPDEITANAEQTGNVLYLSYPLPISRLVGIDIPISAGDLNRFIDGWVKPDVPVPRHLFSIISDLLSTDSENNAFSVKERNSDQISEVAESISKYDRYLGVMAFIRNAGRYFSQKTGHYTDYPAEYFSICERIVGQLDYDSSKCSTIHPLFLAFLDIVDQSVPISILIKNLTQSEEPYIDKNSARAIATEIYNKTGEKVILADAFKMLFNEDYRQAIHLLQKSDMPDEAAVLAALFKYSNRQSNDHRTIKQRFHEDWYNSTRASLSLAALGAYYGYTAMDARETSLYSVNPLISSIIEERPAIKFHLETSFERQIIEGLYQRAFFPGENIADTSIFYNEFISKLNPILPVLPKLFIHDASYKVIDLWVRQYNITPIGRIIQRLMAWNRDTIDGHSEVGQYLFMKLFSYIDYEVIRKDGKQIVLYRIAKRKVIDLIKDNKLDINVSAFELLLEDDIKRSEQ